MAAVPHLCIFLMEERILYFEKSQSIRTVEEMSQERSNFKTGLGVGEQKWSVDTWTLSKASGH